MAQVLVANKLKQGVNPYTGRTAPNKGCHFPIDYECATKISRADTTEDGASY